MTDAPPRLRSRVSPPSSRVGWLLAAACLVYVVDLVVPPWLAGRRGVGDDAPAFAAMVVAPVERAGTVRTDRDLRDSVVLLDFWATWCTNCMPALRELETLRREYGPRGLRIVAVALDPARDADAVRAAARALGVGYEVLHDTSGASRDAYLVTGVPMSVLVDRQGVVRRKVFGVLPSGAHVTEWTTARGRAAIEQVLAER